MLEMQTYLGLCFEYFIFLRRFFLTVSDITISLLLHFMKSKYRQRSWMKTTQMHDKLKFKTVIKFNGV